MMLSRRSAGPLLAAALLALDAGGARAQGQIVRLPEQDRALAGTAPQVFAIGKADGAEHEMFAIVEGVAFDASDNLYVLDRQQARVMVYDRTGRFLRQIGRKGEGPGELIVPVEVLVSGDGTIVVQDLGRPGLALFRADGTFIRNVRTENWMPVRASGLAWHPRGGVVGVFRQAPPETIRAGTSVQEESTVPLLLQPISGGAPTRIFNVPQQSTVRQSGDGSGGTMMRVTGPPSFAPQVLFGVLPGGQVALSFTSGYTVRVVDTQGRTLRYLQRPVRTRLTTDADRERAREERREMLASGRGMIRITTGGGGAPPPLSPERMERAMGEMRFADTIPALRGLRVTPSGKLWIERTGPVVGEDGPVDVVTPEGQYLGTLPVAGLPDAISRGGLGAYVEEDADGVQRVIVRRLPAGWR
jgi:hypothetical protein